MTDDSLVERSERGLEGKYWTVDEVLDAIEDAQDDGGNVSDGEMLLGYRMGVSKVLGNLPTPHDGVDSVEAIRDLRGHDD